MLADEGVALVKYKSPDAAALALGSLNGVEVLGETLKVRSSPPLGMQTSMAGMVGGGRKSL